MVILYQIGTVVAMLGIVSLSIKLSNKVQKEEDERRK